jgi:lysophospholipase
VQAQGQQPTFIFAHSMGGLVTTLLLHQRPDLIDGAILSAPMHAVELKGVPRFMALLLAQVANGLGFGTSYAFGQIGPRKPEFNESVGTSSRPRWELYANIYGSPEEWPLALGGASFRWLRESVRTSILIDDDAWASQIKTPILLFQAEHDTYVSPDAQNAFCSRAPHCQKIFVPGTRHEIYREQETARASYMNSIRQFLNERTRPGQNPATHP